MKSSQLVWSAAAVFALTSGACNRPENRQEAQQAAQHAAGEVKAAAAQAGDKLSDGWVTTKVQAQFFADKDIKARYIDVSTRDGVVTLGGYVDSDAARRQAVEVARNTDGVRQVNDQLLIGQRPSDAVAANASTPARPASDPVATTGVAPAADRALGRLDDARITSAVQAKYFLDTTVKGRDIDVDTRSGVVTLRGRVGSEAERAQALLLARNTDGVERVEDNLTVDAALTR